MAINQDIKALIPKEGIDYYYLLSYLKYKEKELVSMYVKTGTTVESIIMNLFLKLEVPFPSYEEQIKISNFYLIKARMPYIDYVILHELTHFLYPNHSKQFYMFLSNYMPDWKERKCILDQEVVHGL